MRDYEKVLTRCPKCSKKNSTKLPKYQTAPFYTNPSLYRPLLKSPPEAEPNPYRKYKDKEDVDDEGEKVFNRIKDDPTVWPEYKEHLIPILKTECPQPQTPSSVLISVDPNSYRTMNGMEMEKTFFEYKKKEFYDRILKSMKCFNIDKQLLKQIRVTEGLESSDEEDNSE